MKLLRFLAIAGYIMLLCWLLAAAVLFLVYALWIGSLALALVAALWGWFLVAELRSFFLFLWRGE